MQISADLTLMSLGQREALSGFILTYPLIDRRESVEVLPSDVATDRRLAEPSPEEAFARHERAEPILIPSAPVTLTLQAPGTDKSGLPWDERIHSSSKALTADGLWRKKRGVDEALVAQVEGQLKQLMALPAPAAAFVAVTGADPVDGAYATTAPIPAAPTPIALVPAPPPAAEILPPADGRQAFINFIDRISKAIQAGKLTQAEVQAACERTGVPSLPLLAQRLDLVPRVAMDVEAIIVSR